MKTESTWLSSFGIAAGVVTVMLLISILLGCGPAPEYYQATPTPAPTVMPSNVEIIGAFPASYFLYVVENGCDTIYLYNGNLIVSRGDGCDAR